MVQLGLAFCVTAGQQAIVSLTMNLLRPLSLLSIIVAKALGKQAQLLGSNQMSDIPMALSAKQASATET